NETSKANPNSSDGLVLKGRVLLAQNKTQEALKELQQSVRNEPSSTVARYYLGLAYLQANDRLKAENEWTEAARSGGGCVPLYLSMAELKLNSSDAESAATYARQAVNMNPNLP